mgnify:FL=1
MQSLINQRSDLISGIKYAQEAIEGSVTLLILTEDDAIIAARDKLGRLPVLIGKDEEAMPFPLNPSHIRSWAMKRIMSLAPAKS